MFLQPLELLAVGGDVPQPAQHQTLGHLGVDAGELALGAGEAVGIVVMALAVGGVGALAMKLSPALAAGQQPRKQVSVALAEELLRDFCSRVIG